jgi:predicted phosphodiesterase
MRIIYMSDLHLEMESAWLGIRGWADFAGQRKRIARHPARGPMLNGLEKPDLVVLAGDVHNGLEALGYAQQVAAYFEAPVVLVAGNHEYYGHDAQTLLPALRAAADRLPEVHFLERDSMMFEVGGEKVKVLGCTLWTDFALHGDSEAAAAHALRMMNDYRLINVGGLKLGPMATQLAHRDSRRWLLDELQHTARDVKRLVVTHHAPTPLALGQRQGRIAPAYASDLVGEFVGQVDLWIHGHTHFRHESLESGIRIASAPRGYVGYDAEASPRFRPGIIEL